MDKGNLHPFPSLFIRICFSLIIYIFCISAHADDTGGVVTSFAIPDPIPVKFNPYPDPIQPPPPIIEYGPPQAAEGKAEPLLPSPTLPELDHVVQGRLDIVKQDKHMDMMQGQEDVVANFRSFNIGDGHSVHLHQHQGTRAFFRVINQSDITTINGIFKADGTVYLVTPNGLLIGPNGVLDMQNVLLTTHDISNAAFLNLPHTQTLSLEPAINPGAIISNHGTIQTTGFAALVAPTVRNAGLIQGNIFVGAGGKADLSFAGNDLIQMRISGKLKRSLIDQRSTGKLSAQGKKVVITAGAVEEAANGIINLRGTIDASDGQIIVEGAENTRLKVHGDLSVEGTTGKGGKIYLNAPITHIEKTATLNASSQEYQGGDINVFGDHIGVYGDKTFQTRGAVLDASGGTGGGTILVGGGKRGQGDEPRAKSLFVDYGTTMKADATRSGDAGDIVLWSDTVTRMYGFNSASALGENGGAGTIEWSGKKFLHFEQRPLFYPKLIRKDGKIGTIIIDPWDINIDTGSNPYDPAAIGSPYIGATWISGQLNSGVTVDLFADNKIWVRGIINSSNGTLNFRAPHVHFEANVKANNVTIAASLTGNITVYDIGVNYTIEAVNALNVSGKMDMAGYQIVTLK
ncbi:MAG: filamentous hemagglutinin N-terminal domain-containing protein, partial [Alphaproteobacteria bacterium]|nr:filamentous hemagglutinin N-terminal domain-containing protein [Alphaproteobacteria bacterium]